MAQFDRTQVINEFKKRDMPILIATDVAGASFIFL
jgi:superfamily II DNA/RNA helicase